MLVSDLDLPAFDHTDLRGERFHRVLGELAAQSWLARSDLGYLVLEREAVMEFLRDRRLAFPSVQILELQGITDGPVHDRTKNGLMAQTGADHSRLRRLVSPAFTPKATKRLEPRLRELMDELWADIAPAGRCDFVTAVAERLPSMVIAELLGLPGEEKRLAQWSADLQRVFSLDVHSDRSAMEQAYLEVYRYIGEMVDERRGRPGDDDLIATLATLELDGDRLSDDECVTLVCSVIAGGTDTTQAQLSHGMRLFIEHPDQWDLLAEQPGLTGQATNEILRVEPITPFTARLVIDELTYRDVAFPPDTVVFACTATANRDASAFAAPDRFDIRVDRGTTQVLTFGFGSHFCLGANLARAEIAECFAYLAPRMRSPRLDGEAVFGPTAGIYGMESLPVAFGAADV